MKYFTQRRNTDCLLTSLECLTQTPRENLWGLDYFPGGYLTYGSVARALDDKRIGWGYIDTNITDVLCNESGPMILGIASKNIGYLHSVFYDGSWIWEPQTGDFMSETIREVQVFYAMVPYSSLRMNKNIGSPKWMDYFDNNIIADMNRKSHSKTFDERVRSAAVSNDPSRFLCVI